MNPLRDAFFPGLLPTGRLDGRFCAVRHGFVNSYVVSTDAGLLLVDTGWSAGSLARGLDDLGLDPRNVAAVLLTHAHWDHARGLSLVPQATVYAGAGENVPGDVRRVRDDERLEIAGAAVHVVATPGHTPGALSFVVDGRLFVGDALRLRHGIVTAFPSLFDRDHAGAARSIARLALLPWPEDLFTAHTGGTADVARAFAPWSAR